ncbi:MAG TPA: diguanylate cyclase [Patescibacteria group bacterium]
MLITMETTPNLQIENLERRHACPVIETDLDGNLINANSQFYSQFRLEQPAPDSPPLNLTQVLSPAGLKSLRTKISRFDLSTVSPQDIVASFADQIGDRQWSIRFLPVVGNTGDLHSFTFSFNDITELTQDLEDAGKLDPLTGAFNRRFMEEKMDRLIQKGIPFTTVFLDFRAFKKINDTYGHSKGDEVLGGFFDLYNENLRNTDFIGRYADESAPQNQSEEDDSGNYVTRFAGDEWVVLMLNTTQEEAAQAVDRLRKIQQEKVSQEDPEDPVLGLLQYDVGYAEYNPASGSDTDSSLVRERLLADADKNMYEDKKQNRPSSHRARQHWYKGKLYT